ncbi:ATP-binding protein [Paenibacillus sp. LHD-117]|uniref:ATP-binding protein n=1 Tax=Paenibacillus sp. LHD-117 TaxID=3071412 RepID=UPI0027DF3DC8|nr:ATP-binding protein [Paenibacillus sp. LHD-117]MDQ6422636.1 ATP-binding protein [Paenibacillus sp. LHD-117]
MNPWWFALGGAVAVSTLVVDRIQQEKKLQENRSRYRYVRIIPHKDTAASPDKIMRLIQNLHEYKRTRMDQVRKGKEWFRYLIHKDIKGEIALYIGFPEDRQTGIMRAYRNIYPEIELHDVQHSDLPLSMTELPVDSEKKAKDTSLYGGHFLTADKGPREGFAFKTYSGEEDIEDILYSLDASAKETECWLDILISPVSNNEIRRRVQQGIKSIYRKHGITDPQTIDMSLRSFGDALKGSAAKKATKATAKPSKTRVSLADLDPDDKERIRMMQKRFTGRETAFAVSIRLLAHGKHAHSIAQTAATAVRSAFHFDNALRFVRDRNLSKSIFDSAPMPSKINSAYMTGEELSNIFRLPRGEHRIYQYVPHLQKGQELLKDDEFIDGISLGKMLHPLMKGREVRMPITQFTRHWFLSGMTGAGKSSFLLELIESMVQTWLANPNDTPGFSLSDPAQETAITILNRLCHYEKMGIPVDWSKVHYFDLGSAEYVLPLNILKRMNNESVHGLSDEAFDLIKTAYGGDTPQMDRILRNALTTLISDTSQDHNVLGIIPLLMEKRFRDRVLPHVKDKIILQFWEREFPDLEKKIGQAVGPLLNRLSPFQTNEAMRRMFGQPKMGLELRKWMDEGHIVLFNMKNVNQAATKLSGGFIANQFHKTAQTRATGSKVHISIYDEAHRTQYPIMNKIIAEDRKFGLSLGLSTQSIGQMDAEIINSVTEIVNNIFSTAQGPKSAAVVQQMTAGAFDRDFLQKLPERMLAVYTRAKVEGRNQPKTFTVECDPPYLYRPDGSGEWANHEDEREMQAALAWGEAKGLELMARDCLRADEVDEMIDEYLTTGTVLQRQKKMIQEQIELTTDTGPSEKKQAENVTVRPASPPPKIQRKRNRSEMSPTAESTEKPSAKQPEEKAATPKEADVMRWEF